MQFKTTANFVRALYQHCVGKPAIFLASSDSVFTQNKLQSIQIQQLPVAST